MNHIPSWKNELDDNELKDYIDVPFSRVISSIDSLKMPL
jgi:hypothetical protein